MEESSEKVVEKKAEQIKNKTKEWFSDPYNISILGIFIFMIIIRFYYFWITKNQPLWWDESEYMAAAKSYAGLGHYELQGIRLPGFPLLMSVFFMLGIANEPIMRFFALFLPSLALIFLTYFMMIEMYSDKRVAIISTIIISVLWEHLFYSNRFQTENLSLVFEFLAIIIFFRVYLKNNDIWFIKKRYCLIWITLFILISILIRPGNIFFVPAIILFVLFVNMGWFLESKTKKYSLLVSAITLIISGFFVLQNLSKIPFLSSFARYYNAQNPLAWNSFSAFYGFYQPQPSIIPAFLFYAFILGLLVLIFDFIFYYKKILSFRSNSDELSLKSDEFNIFLVTIVMAAMIFIVRSNTSFEYRWFFPLLPGMLAITAKGLTNAAGYIKLFTKSKILSGIFIILILICGVYTQMNYSDNIIKIKINSYQEVKDSGLWLKENSNKNDVIVSASLPQHSYYSERKIEDFHNDLEDNESGFDKQISEIKPKYVILSIFEPGFTPGWAYSWPQKHNDTVAPIKAYFLDDNKQPNLIIYEVSYR